MSVIQDLVLFIVGLGFVIYFAERLVKALVGTSLHFGLSAFLISVVFLGFDPENLAVGAAGAWAQAAGIALGSIVGACMVAIALALGMTAIVAPMSFGRAPRTILAAPPLAIAVFAILALDGRLSRLDGGILLAAFALSIGLLVWLGRRGATIRASGEVAETLEEGAPGRWGSLVLFVVSLAAVVGGSEMLVNASQGLLERIGLSQTYFGMVILSLLVSIEELARELPAAWKGRPDISFGNVVGSVLAFFLFNAGIVALVRPVGVDEAVLRFYLPVCLATAVAVSLLMFRNRIGRAGGAILLGLYAAFVVGGFVLFGSVPGSGG